jgi:protein-S-isoprenylcysteine O-methyltransferase Ste14
MRPLAFSDTLLYPVVFWSAYALWLALELTWSRKRWSRGWQETVSSRAAKPSAGSRESNGTSSKDRGSFWLIVVLMWVALGLAFALAFGLPQAAILWRRSLVFWTGIVLMLVGMGFRYYAIRTLGRFFTFNVAVHSGQTVVERGLYRYIRHPSYAAGLITLAGIGVALGNWASVGALLTLMAVAYGYRIQVEETALVAALGAPYQAYRSRTKRLIPFVF